MTNSKRLSSAQLRALYLEFFRSQGHQVVASSALIPGNDPTLLFTNAGMVQFKDVFLGKEQRPYVRAASSQRCLRAGGKHNDLENVGYTARHHTFFEMLGNFSFGDYFKRDAIRYAWEFVTGKDWLAIDPARLMVTVYHTDQEAYDVWHKEVGLAAERIVRIGDKPNGTSDNFWQMGDTGPCGPCTEIFYDHGPEIPGGPPGSPDQDGDRWIEIWNLVFMQFDRSADGELKPLPKPSVDTGMGLERVAAVMQGVHSNYQIDLFTNLVKAAAAATGTTDMTSSSLQVIADHIRACSFLITDGVLPSNEGRGYVLRRIARRALRHGHKLGCTEPFFHRLVAPLVAEMGTAFPELAAQQQHVERVLAQEEARFAETLSQGVVILERAISQLQGTEIGGQTAFELWDTYGFPVDLTADMARERGLTVDQTGFERCMEEQRERSQNASKFGVDLRAVPTLEVTSQFTGYERDRDAAVVAALLRDNVQVSSLAAGERGQVILDHTPFYGESGGQVGDAGELRGEGVAGESLVFQVEDTQKLGAAVVHVGVLRSGALTVGQRVLASVDVERRTRVRLNHSATHLLHAALRQVLGKHVTQKGSLVAPDRLRFDFSHYAAVSAAELAEIERLVNVEIRRNAAAETQLMAYDAAVKSGAMALFDEKYADEVRVLRFGDFSVELCGGTHVARAGDIGLFKILSESGTAAGIRRIEAVTGQDALDWVGQAENVLKDLAGLMKSSRAEVETKVKQLLERSRKLEKEIASLKAKLTSGQSADLSAGAVAVGSLRVVATRVEQADAQALRTAVDQLKDKLQSAAIVLASVDASGKIVLIGGVTANQTSRIKAGDLVNNVAQQVGGRGGGRADLAQAGGNDPTRLDAALASVVPWVEAQLERSLRDAH